MSLSKTNCAYFILHPCLSLEQAGAPADHTTLLQAFFYQLSFCSLKTKGPLLCATAFSSRHTIRYRRLSAPVCRAGKKAVMKKGKSACSTPLHLLTFLAGPCYKLVHSHRCSIWLFVAARNTRQTASSQPKHDCYQIPTQRLLEVWTRPIFPMYTCLGTHSPFSNPNANHQGPPPAVQSPHSAGVVETQSTHLFGISFLHWNFKHFSMNKQCYQMWPGFENLVYPLFM